MLVSLGTMVLLTFAISALALGFGALYPRFDTENAAQIPTSFGGLVYMMSAVILLVVVLMVESRPIMRYLRLQIAGRPAEFDPWLVGSLVLVVIICLTATIIPLRLGLKKMESMEF
jgi:ABC-2 type transport system permease protein